MRHPKKEVFLGCSPKCRTPSPLLRTLVAKNKVRFIFVFGCRTIFVFTKMFTFWSLCRHILLGIGDPPPSQRIKFQKILVIAYFCSQKSQDFESRLCDEFDELSHFHYCKKMFCHQRKILLY